MLYKKLMLISCFYLRWFKQFLDLNSFISELYYFISVLNVLKKNESVASVLSQTKAHNGGHISCSSWVEISYSKWYESYSRFSSLYELVYTTGYIEAHVVIPPVHSHLSPPVHSHLSPLTSHLSPLTSHLSPLTYYRYPITYYILHDSLLGTALFASNITPSTELEKVFTGNVLNDLLDVSYFR